MTITTHGRIIRLIADARAATELGPIDVEPDATTVLPLHPDSMGLAALTFLSEEGWDIEVAGDELAPGNLEALASFAAFVDRRGPDP